MKMYVYVEDGHGCVVHDRELDPNETMDPDVFLEEYLGHDIGYMEVEASEGVGDYSVIFSYNEHGHAVVHSTTHYIITED